MRHALLAAPLLPLALALAVAGPRVADGLPAVPMSAIDRGHEWRVAVVDDAGVCHGSAIVHSRQMPTLEYDAVRLHAVSAIGLICTPDVAALPPPPPGWCYRIARID